jgi:formate hydrogenlyase subunit 3/multisubunit Na+/H+ antiporter MnhD subunit
MKQSSLKAAPRPAAGPEFSGWSVKNILAAGARAWNFSPRQTTFISLIVPALVMLAGAATALMGKEVYKWFTGEDGAAENLQVLFFALAFVLCFPVIARLWKAGAQARQAKLFAAMYLVLSLGLFFIIGEELSWGQRIFGWETSEELKAINKQEETNIHNIEGIGDKIKWLHVVMGAYGTILPLIFLRAQISARPLDAVSLLVPHFTLLPYFLSTLLWRLQANLWKPPKRLYFVITEYSEVMELVLAIAFFVFLLFQFRNLKSLDKPAMVEDPVLNSTQRMKFAGNHRAR